MKKNAVLVVIIMAIFGAFVGWACVKLLVPATLAGLTPLFVGVGLVSGLVGAIVSSIASGGTVKA